jgi:hypothetical protein
MERALEQEDIIFHILTFVNSKDTLVNLAQVSRSFSTVALDQLWGSNDINVNVLARCMKARFWNEIKASRKKVNPIKDPRHSYQLVG